MVLRITGQGLCRMGPFPTPSRDLSCGFLMTGPWVLEGKTAKAKCHFHHILSRARAVNMTCPDRLAVVELVRFHACKVRLPLCVLFSVQPTLNGWQFILLYFLENRRSTEITWDSFCADDFFSLPMYLLIQSLIYISRDAWIFVSYFGF